MPDIDITKFRTTDFDEDIRMEYQQRGAVLEGTYYEEEMVGNESTFNVMGKQEAVQATTLYGDTPPPPNLANYVRQVIPTKWMDTQWIDETEWHRSMATGGKLQPKYARNLAYSLGRAKDRIVLNAMVGTAMNREFNLQTQLPTLTPAPFDPAQVIPHNDLPFSVDKIVQGVAKLKKDEAYDGRIWCIIDPWQEAQLMRDTQFTSFDFNSARPLQNGHLGSFYTVNFVCISILDEIEGLQTSTVQTALMWNQDAVGFKRLQPMETFVDVLPQKQMTIQLYCRATGGFTRIQDKGVIKIESAIAA